MFGTQVERHLAPCSLFRTFSFVNRPNLKRPTFYNKNVTQYMKSKIIPELRKLIKILEDEK